MELLSRVLRWFVSGVAFAVGVGAVMLGWSVAREYVFPPPSVLVNAPKDLAIVSIEPLAVTVSAGVRATIRNTSSASAYSPASYDLSLFAGEKLLASCDARYRSVQVEPGSTAQVQLNCSDVNREALPAGVTYKVTIKDAWRFH